MHRLIASWTLSEETFDIGGHIWPDAVLLSDDDGVLIFATATPEIPTLVWTDAEARGASIVAFANEGKVWAITSEDFLAHRRHLPVNSTFGMPEDVTWIEVTSDFTYRSFLDAKEEQTAPAAAENFVHLHTHSEFSALDGLTTVQEMVDRAVAMGQPAIAITDHGVCSAHPQLQKVAAKAGIKPIFGVEAYLVDDRLFRPKSAKPPTPLDEKDLLRWKEEAAAEVARARSYYHLILWAQTDEGLRNLWAMTTEANRSGSYYVPRMDWDLLSQYGEGVMCSTACLHGPLAYPLNEHQDEGLALANLGRLQAIFPDRLYVELHTTSVAEQKPVNEWLVSAANKHGLPLIAVTDSHYCLEEDQAAHDVWIAIQTNKDLQDENYLFAGHHPYHLMNRAEAVDALSYLPPSVVHEALDNTVLVADRCTATVSGKSDPPVYSKKGSNKPERVVDDVSRLVDLCVEHWDKTFGKTRVVNGVEVPITQDEYLARFETEMTLLKEKGFCGYFLMVADYCLYAKTHNILVGPGRGSGGGCLVAYLCGITEIDPVEADLLFERFLNPGRDELPDFDVDFPASKREEMTNYLIERWGEEFVIRVGTHVRLKNKGIFRDLERVLKSTIEIHHPDIDAISKVIERAEADSAGLGYKWADILSTHEDEFRPFFEKYPTLFNFAGRLTGRLKTYGKHPAGIVISPDEPILNRLPMWFSKDGMPITEFDMDALTSLGLVKFDILTIRTLDTIQMAMDLIEQHTGSRIDIYNWREEYADSEVWDTISAGNTLGMFQIETHAVTRLCKRLGPRNLSELSDVITLVRPGPVKSGLTETYFRRRNGEEAVSYPHPDLESVLNKTYGCMLYQEDIMNVCRVIGGYSLEEADGVRKILGKKKVDEAIAAGAIFIERAVANGYEKQLAESLWAQMEEFAKYSFNRSHAWGYAMLSHWTAWLKVHYPIEFMTAVLSTIDKTRIPSFVQEARRLDLKVLPPDVNLSGQGFRGHPDRQEIRYGLDGVMGVGEAKVKAIEAGQPYASFEDFLDRSGVDSGITRILVTIGAFDNLHPNRAALIETLEWQTSDASTRCNLYGASVTVGNDKGESWSLPCTYNWSEEPVEFGPSGRAKKRKAPPKRCTKACRQYVQPSPPERDLSIPNEMTPEQVMAIEKEYLGMHLTVTPFDFFPPAELANFSTLEAIEAGLPGNYGIAAVIEKVRVTTDRHQREMAFIHFTLHDGGSLSVPAFSSQWASIKDEVWEGRLVAAVVEKQSGIHSGCIFARQEDSSLPAYYPISN